MKPILTYYGGKQKIAEWFVDHFPYDYQKMHYVEPFFGGGAVFFKKVKNRVETINDLDGNLYHFYKVCQDYPSVFLKRINRLIYFEDEFRRATKVTQGKEMAKDNIDRAVCYWFSIMGSFGCSVGSGMKFRKSKRLSQPTINKDRIKTYPFVFKRLKEVSIFNRDAISLIENFNSKDMLFYIDPPYPESVQYYQHTFNKEDFIKLIDVLKKTESKFLLSCYELDWMPFAKEWNKFYLKVNVHINHHVDKERTECLVTNFETQKNLTLF